MVQHKTWHSIKAEGTWLPIMYEPNSGSVVVKYQDNQPFIVVLCSEDLSDMAVVLFSKGSCGKEKHM